MTKQGTILEQGGKGRHAPHDRQNCRLPVIERAIQSLQNIPRLIKMQGADPLLGKVRRVVEGARASKRGWQMPS